MFSGGHVQGGAAVLYADEETTSGGVGLILFTGAETEEAMRISSGYF